jgi:hypothetical protein
MARFIGNNSLIIDWDRVIKDLENQSPEYVGPGHSFDDDIEELKDIKSIWKNSYSILSDGGTVGWDMFFPGKQFDQKVADVFCDFVELDSPKSVWISRIWPGNLAPVHWDVNSNEQGIGNLNYYRYHCHIQEPKIGHIFIVDNELYYQKNKGDTFLWKSRKSWHAGANCGLSPKYIFNAWG